MTGSAYVAYAPRAAVTQARGLLHYPEDQVPHPSHASCFMQRTRLGPCLLLLPFLSTFTAPACAQERAPEKVAQVLSLDLFIDSSGEARVSIFWAGGKPLGEPSELRKVLERCLEGSTEVAASEEPMDYGQVFRNRGAFARHGTIVCGRMELTPLMEMLRGRGVVELFVQISYPRAGFESCTLPGPSSAEEEQRRRASAKAMRRMFQASGLPMPGLHTTPSKPKLPAFRASPDAGLRGGVWLRKRNVAAAPKPCRPASLAAGRHALETAAGPTCERGGSGRELVPLFTVRRPPLPDQ